MQIYPYTLTPDEDGRLLVSFPDFDWGVTDGADEAEAAAEAADCLRTMLIALMKNREPIPTPSPPAPGQPVVVLPALVAVKLALYRAMRQSKTSNVALAKRLGVTETVVRRLLDLRRDSRLDRLEAALEAIGYRMALEVRPAA